MSEKKPHRKGKKPSRAAAPSAPTSAATKKPPAVEKADKKPFVRVGKKHRETLAKEPWRKEKPAVSPSLSKGHVATTDTLSSTAHRARRSEGGARSTRTQEGSVTALRDRPSTHTTTQSPTATGSIRLAKRIADAGICSRRDAEKLIATGAVTVNGTRIDTPAFTVTTSDYVKVNGKLIRNTPSEERLFLYHKPRGLITTTRDTHARPTVFESLPKDLPRLISVGRLDLDSEGLLLLTTSGSIARNLELPANGIKRTYRVRILGALQPESIAKLARGVTVEGIQYGPIHATPEPATSDGRNRWVQVVLTEGKNREIRRVFESLGHTVSRLIRTSYGPFTLGKLPRGTVMEMKQADWKKALAGILPQ